MSAARKSSSTEREAGGPKPGQRTSGWRQSRCSLDSHYFTNHTLTVREGVKTQSRPKFPGAPQTSTLSLCLIEQFNVMLGTVPRHSIRYHLLSSTFSLSSARRFPNGLTRRAEGTPNSHILLWLALFLISRAPFSLNGLFPPPAPRYIEASATRIPDSAAFQEIGWKTTGARRCLG